MTVKETISDSEIADENQDDLSQLLIKLAIDTNEQDKPAPSQYEKKLPV